MLQGSLNDKRLSVINNFFARLFLHDKGLRAC